MENIISLFDIQDPLDIVTMVDDDIENMLRTTEGDNYQTIFTTVNIREFVEENYDDSKDCCEDKDFDVDTYDTIDDDSIDFLDMEADEYADSLEDDDSDGELIDMAIAGYGMDGED